ncbi:toprim domain-containing protein [Croceitalea sp. MTPC9]|uniref:toprim domain-containing protein n=1 Tax=unclassified Croceitalea TaxID=2632280 RepID=UPI002B393AD6|nr:toprim domain-containing protein [Croceitalea sp. MTPC6]GMN16660.1 toprim domain-containing protein [Croceitalea sp. MTPC9]
MERRKKLKCEEARNISVLEVLEKFGHSPQRENTKEAWYLSPLRSEHQASFKVSKNLNRWYDHGIGKGGNVIDLVCLMANVDVKQALKILSREHFKISMPPLPINVMYEKKGIEILDIKKINHPALIEYLMERYIPLHLARQYCKEVIYKIDGRSHFSIGLENRSGGWELRNKYFKNSASPKDVTFLKNGKKKLIVTEGMFDMLSLLELNPSLEKTHDILVMNSTAFTKRTIPIIKEYTTAQLFLDNDDTGKKATTELMANTKNGIDESHLYKAHKDVNVFRAGLGDRRFRSAIQDVSLCTQRPPCFSPKGRKGKRP